MSATEIKLRLGQQRIAERVGVGENAVYNVKHKFPPGWYPYVKEMCDEEGIDCPLSAFGWTKRRKAPEVRAAE